MRVLIPSPLRPYTGAREMEADDTLFIVQALSGG